MVYLLFFLSGAAGLIYEIVWSRELGLLFGHTVHAAAVVLGAYFAGMALGYLWAGRLSARLVRPLAGYGVAELCVALWAVLTPWLLSMLAQPALATLLNNDNQALQLAIRAGVSFLVLLPATIALGATLPFIAQHVSARAAADGGRRIALAYACNTAGAFVGVMAATYALILLLGVRESGYLAAALSAACGFTALVLARRSIGGALSLPDMADGADTSTTTGGNDLAVQQQPASSAMAYWYVLAALSGFGTLGLQVLYTRMFALTFHNSTYTFGGVVAVFLLALAAGSAFVSRHGRRYPARPYAALACALGAPLVALSVFIFQHFTRLGYFTASGGFAGYLAAAFGLITLAVFPPVFVIGTLLPYCFSAIASGGKHTGAAVGKLTALNTIAATIGALGTSFLLLPALGLWRGFSLYALLYWACGLIVLSVRQQLPGAFRWQRSWLAWLLFVSCPAILLATGNWPQSVVSKKAQLIFERETPYGLIGVQRAKDSGDLWLMENNHYVLGATVGADSEFRQGRLPLLLHFDPQDVCYLGLATGITASAALADPGVKSVSVVELVPAVVDAAWLFASHNRGVLNDPRVTIVINDARHYLYATPRQFDVIVSDLFVPWHSQTGYLYTVEHYQAARRRLKPRGIFCQWLPLYQLGPREFELIANSMARVFPVVTLWRGELGTDDGPLMALVGSDQPLKLDGSSLTARLSALRDPPWGREPLLVSARAVLQLYVATWKKGGSWRGILHDPPCRCQAGAEWISSPQAPAGSLNTDDRPLVEFLAPVTNRRNEMLTGERLSKYYLQLKNLSGGGLTYTLRQGEESPWSADRLQRQLDPAPEQH